jgi:hypothetical protein
MTQAYAGTSAVELIENSPSGWWAGQDSNLQPDRYERPALTIELPARWGAARGKAQNARAGNAISLAVAEDGGSLRGHNPR